MDNETKWAEPPVWEKLDENGRPIGRYEVGESLYMGAMVRDTSEPVLLMLQATADRLNLADQEIAYLRERASDLELVLNIVLWSVKNPGACSHGYVRELIKVNAADPARLAREHNIEVPDLLTPLLAEPPTEEIEGSLSVLALFQQAIKPTAEPELAE